MKAAILKKIGEPQVIEDIDEPEVIPNGVKIRVLASHILSYTHDVFSGKRVGRLVPPVPLGNKDW